VREREKLCDEKKEIERALEAFESGERRRK
jgi:hypothetical protein